MRRFLLFPLVLGVVGIVAPTLWAFESGFVSALVLWSDSVEGAIDQSVKNVVVLFLFSKWGFFYFTRYYGVILGMAAGLGFAFYDGVRNRDDQSAAYRLTSNLLGCSLYSSLVVGFNIVIFRYLSLYITGGALVLGSTTAQQMTPFVPLAVGLLHVVVFFWASLRSITTNDVLNPRVLRDKLHRSTHALLSL